MLSQAELKVLPIVYVSVDKCRETLKKSFECFAEVLCPFRCFDQESFHSGLIKKRVRHVNFFHVLHTAHIFLHLVHTSLLSNRLLRRILKTLLFLYHLVSVLAYYREERLFFEELTDLVGLRCLKSPFLLVQVHRFLVILFRLKRHAQDFVSESDVIVDFGMSFFKTRAQAFFKSSDSTAEVSLVDSEVFTFLYLALAR